MPPMQPTCPRLKSKEARYSRRVEMAEIEKNDFNLNISRYIITAVSTVKVNLEEVHQQRVAIEQNMAAAKQKHNSFLSELGLPLLP